ncbi:peptidase inhibitor family I36 protein [Streptomyces sp. P38-E01]|uniref:Peptidase inhibitor family I36 protein n=1 Tax=Streptomyces tardus TaxID=2780544 RepID=A0A949JTH8_9ACTN|nr:peptidase inhibitor family I36 protein [Streptomyces tardus]MBU7599845.1 peptidase inhibitor family I36 protein [Streptomyces tardus]
MKKARALAAAAAATAAGAAILIAPGTAQAAEDTRAQAAWNCAKGNVCFYSGAGGTGVSCRSDGTEARWVNQTCLNTTFKSFYNNGYVGPLDHVRAYTGFNFTGTSYCLHVGWDEGRGSFPGSGVKLKSHKWFTGEC